MADIRSPIGMMDTGVPMANGSSCDDLVLMVSAWCGLSSVVIVSRVRPDGQLLQPSDQHSELLVCAELVQAVNADLNRLGLVVGDTVDVFGAAHDRLQSHS
jgi:hypothetical protein